MVQNIIKKSNSKIEYRGIYIHPKMPVLLMARVPKGGTIENFKNYISILNIDTSNFALKSELSDFALKSEFDKYALKSELPKCKEYYLVKEEYRYKKVPNDYTKGIKEVLSNDDLSGSNYRDYLTTNLNDIPAPLAATTQANFTIDQYAIDGKTKIGHWEFNPTPEKVVQNIIKNNVKIIYTYLLEFKPDPNFDFTKDSDGDGIPDYKDTTPVGIEDPEATEEIKNDKNYVKPTQPYSSETSNVMQGLKSLATNDKAWTFSNIQNYSVFLYKDNKLISSAKADRDGNLVLHDNDGFSLKNNYDLYVQEKGKLTKKVDKVDVVISGNAHGKFIKDNQKVDYIQYKVFKNFNLSPFKDEIPIPTEIEPGYKFRKYDVDFNSEIFSNVTIDLVISAKYDLLDDIKILFIVPNSTRFPEEKYVKPNGTLKLFTKDEFLIPNGNLIKWKRQSDGKEFNPGDSIPNITKEETFEAIWENNRVTLTYDKGNGTGELETKSETKEKGETISISNIRNVTPPVGYTWGGWKIEGKTYQPGMPYKITKDVTAYAIYIQNSYTITFDTKGGTPIERKTVKHGESLTLPTKNEVSQVDFELKSWERDSDKKLFNPGDIVENITQDETFRAIWGYPIVSITFNPNGGTGDPMPTMSGTNGDKINLPKATFTPPKDKIFSHWEIIEGA